MTKSEDGPSSFGHSTLIRHSSFVIPSLTRHSCFDIPAAGRSNYTLVEHGVGDLKEPSDVRAIYIIAGSAETFRGCAAGFVNRLHDTLQPRIDLFARP